MFLRLKDLESLFNSFKKLQIDLLEILSDEALIKVVSPELPIKVGQDDSLVGRRELWGTDRARNELRDRND